MKIFITTLMFISLALSAPLVLGLANWNPADAKSSFITLNAASSGIAAQSTGVTLPRANIYALNSDNTIFVLGVGATDFTRLVNVKQVEGNLIGIDFRPADGSLYGLTDTGKVYTINLSAPQLGAATLVSTLTTRFAGGFQSLADFNPVVNALRLIGSNDQNLAVVNSGGNLNVTAAQTNMAYAQGDVNAGKDPNIAGGSYTKNYPGAPNTIFYGLDYDLDAFVTIAPPLAGNGSSNTGGGQLQTLGPIVDGNGNTLKINPTADLDIYTDANGQDMAVGISGRTLFTINLSQINPSQAVGTTQNVAARTLTMFSPGGGYIDLAVQPASTATPTPTPAPTPKPTPTPTPNPTPGAGTVQAETGMLGGGAWVRTNQAGFTGTGFVDFADNKANSFVQFALNLTGQRTISFRYANGSTDNRTCSITLNGVPVGSLTFPPTGSWTTWKQTTLVVNFGNVAGSKALRLTALTVKGGPNLDKLDIQ